MSTCPLDRQQPFCLLNFLCCPLFFNRCICHHAHCISHLCVRWTSCCPFFESISFPRKDESLHALLLDENSPNPTASITAPRRIMLWSLPFFSAQQDSQSYGTIKLGVLNDPKRLGGARLQ
eukprot:scaffold2934_cov109-Cylindrotheca_fusiformis.AAC.1